MRLVTQKHSLLFLACMLIFAPLHRGIGGELPTGAIVRSEAAADSAIRSSIDRMNQALATKDFQTVMNVFDDADDIIVIGSDTGEVFIGRERVKVFMKMIVSMPFVFSFDMNQVVISHNEQTAWVFVDGNMVHTRSSGKVTKVPYRIMAVTVRRGNDWKWKVFSGSIPRGE